MCHRAVREGTQMCRDERKRQRRSTQLIELAALDLGYRTTTKFFLTKANALVPGCPRRVAAARCIAATARRRPAPWPKRASYDKRKKKLW